MEVSKAFVYLIMNHNDSTAGEWLKQGNSYLCRFIDMGSNRGRLVYVKHYPAPKRELVAESDIELMAIIELHGDLSPRLGKLSQGELLDLIRSYKRICSRLFEKHDEQERISHTFRKVKKALAGRRFDPETLEFDIQIPEVSDPASIQLAEELERYWTEPIETEIANRSIEALELSVRAYNLLCRYKIETIGALIRTKQIFYQLKGVGPKVQSEIEELLVPFSQK